MPLRTDKTDVASEAGSSWSGRLVKWVVVLVLANVMVDTVVGAPLLVLPHLLTVFDTDQAAWINSSAMLAAAVWVPLMAKASDIYGRRRILLISLLIGSVGALVCMFATNLGIFVAGRFLQGAAMAAVFLSVALIRQMATPRIASTAVGIVTSGSAALGVISPFFFELVLIENFGYKSVFIVSASLAILAAVLVRVFLPESPKAPGRIDLLGAALLGFGAAAVLGYISIAVDFGWLALGPLALLVTGAIALAAWIVRARHVPNPVVDIRGITRPLGLTMLTVVFGAGAYQSLLQLMSLIVDVSPDQGLGYGLDSSPAAPAILLAAPCAGIALGGTLAGGIAGKIGPALPLLGAALVGALSGIVLFFSVDSLVPASVCFLLLGVTAGAIVTSGFNMAASVVQQESQGVAAGLVQVMLAVGVVVLNVVGTVVLKSTTVTVDGASVNSLQGVHTYVVIAIAAFGVAALLATALVKIPRSAQPLTSV